MIRQCCVCKKIFYEGTWVPPQPLELDGVTVTHGYCETCYKDFIESMGGFTGSTQSLR